MQARRGTKKWPALEAIEFGSGQGGTLLCPRLDRESRRPLCYLVWEQTGRLVQPPCHLCHALWVVHRQTMSVSCHMPLGVPGYS